MAMKFWSSEGEQVQIERVGDELLMTVRPVGDPDETVISFSIPEGVAELTAAIQAEVEGR